MPPRQQSDHQFLDHLLLRQCPIDRHFQFFVDQGLGQQFERPLAQGFDARFDRAVTGNQNDRQLGMVFAAVSQDVEAVAVLQANIDQRQIERFLIDQRGCLLPRRHGIDLVTLLTQPAGHRVEQVTIVVHK